MLSPVLRAVRFRSRPCRNDYGTEWIPKELHHRPYHPAFDTDIVLDDMEERDFECSPALQEYLVDFYGKIKPLCIELPPLRDVPDQDIPALAAQFQSKTDAETIMAFKRHVGVFIGERFNALPPDARKQVPLPESRHLPELTEAEILTSRVIRADMLSMRNELIELKVWVSMFIELKHYLVRRVAYTNELQLRLLQLPISIGGLVKELGQGIGRLLSNCVRRFSSADDESLSDGLPPDDPPKSQSLLQDVAIASAIPSRSLKPRSAPSRA